LNTFARRKTKNNGNMGFFRAAAFSAVFSLRGTSSTPRAKDFVRLVEHLSVRNEDVKSRRMAGPNEKLV